MRQFEGFPLLLMAEILQLIDSENPRVVATSQVVIAGFLNHQQ